MKKTISILGCGWYGLELAKLLLQNGYNVKGSTTTPEKLSQLQATGIEPYLIDLNKANPIFENIFFQTDLLVVSIPPKRSEGIQYTFIEKIAELVKLVNKNKVPDLIFISSTAIYGDLNAEVDESTLPIPLTASGQAMLQAEQMLSKQKDFNTTIIRFAGLVGPGRDPGRFFAGKKDIPNGLAPINLIHLDDCLQLTLKIIQMRAFGYIYNACSPDHPEKQNFYTRAAEKSGFVAPEFISQLLDWKIISSIRVHKILGYNYLVTNWADWLSSAKL